MDRKSNSLFFSLMVFGLLNFGCINNESNKGKNSTSVVDINAPNSNNIPTEDDISLLPSIHTAAKLGDLNTIKRLIKSNVDVNVRDSHRFTALLYAVQEGHFSVVQLLIQSGADVNASTLDSNQKNLLNFSTPLHLAAEMGHLPIAKFLIHSGADINANNYMRFTPLHLSAKNGHLPIAKFLIHSGAKVNLENAYEQTALDLAAKNGHLAIAKLLLRSKATVKRFGWENTMSLAVENGHFSIAELLISPSSSGPDFHTPFDSYVRRISKEMNTQTKIDKWIELVSWFIYQICNGNNLYLTSFSYASLVHSLKTSYESFKDQEKSQLLNWLMYCAINSVSITELIENILKYMEKSNEQNQKIFIKNMSYFLSREDILEEFNSNFKKLKNKFSLDLLKKVKNIFRYQYAQELKRKIFNSLNENILNQLVNLNTIENDSSYIEILSEIKENLIDHCESTKIKSSFVNKIKNLAQSMKNKEISTFHQEEIHNFLKLIKNVKNQLDYIIQQEGMLFTSTYLIGENINEDILLAED